MVSQQQRSDSTRSLILKAFRRSFLEKGFEKTTTSAVLSEIGLSKGALYHHFRSKTEILRALYEAEVEDLLERASRQMGSNDPPLKQLKSASMAWIEAASEPSVAKMIFKVGPSGLGYETVRAIESDQALRRINSLIRAAIKKGDIETDEPELVASLLNALIGDAVLYRVRTGRDINPTLSSMFDSLFDSLKR